MQWHELQAALAAAVRAPTIDVADLFGGPDASLNGRFDVYRNNHVVGLVDALAATFPVVRQMVGDPFFRAMARAYVLASPPRSPILIEYGGTLPTFIADFEPARNLPFLADLAQLEWLRVEAFHAADDGVAAIGQMAQIAPDEVATARLRLHPSLRLLASDWPVFSLWAAHQDGAPPDALASIEWQAECGALVRPRTQVDVLRLAFSHNAFLSAARDGGTMADAMDAAGALAPEDLATLLAQVFAAGTVASIETST